MLRRTFLLGPLALSLAAAAFAQTPPAAPATVAVPAVPADAIDAFVAAEMRRQNIPGLAVAVVREGRVIRILERRNTWLVGRYERGEGGMGYLVPFDRRLLMDVFIPPGQEGGASPGEMVTVELTRWPTATRPPAGRVIEVLGPVDAPGVDTRIIIRKHNLPDAHSADAVAEAESLGSEVRHADIRGRTDVRILPVQQRVPKHGKLHPSERLADVAIPDLRG